MPVQALSTIDLDTLLRIRRAFGRTARVLCSKIRTRAFHVQQTRVRPLGFERAPGSACQELETTSQHQHTVSYDKCCGLTEDAAPSKAKSED